MSRDQKLIEGITKHAGAIATLYVNGEQFTAAQAITTLQSRLSTGNAVPPAKAAYQQSVQADRDERTQTKSFVTGLRQALLLMFTGQPEVLVDLGIEPRKAPAARSVAEKQAAITRARGTRQLRHTMGPKAKAQIQAPPVQPEPVAPAQPTSPAATPPKPQS